MRTYFIIIFLFYCLVAQSQTKWTLKQCLTYANEHNLGLQKQNNKIKSAEYSVKESKWLVAPSIYAGSNLNLDLRRSTNQNNMISSGLSYSSSMYLNGSINIFNGFTVLNNIKAKKILLEQVNEETQQIKNELYLDILLAYTEIVFNYEQVNVANKKFEVAKINLDQIQALVSVGKREQVAADELKATVSGAMLQISRAKNSLSLSKLKLIQLLELPNQLNFDIEETSFSLLKPFDKKYDINNIYETACQISPKLKEQELYSKYLQKQLSIQNGHYAPSLSLGGGYGTNFFSTDTLSTGKTSPFNQQFTNYLNPSLGLYLSIPIFNGRSKEYSRKRLKLDIKNQLYTLKQEKNLVKSQINTSLQMLESNRLEYLYSVDNLKYVEISFKSNSKKYSLGLINSTDFITAQNQLAGAQLSVINSKLNWIIQDSIIQLFMGIKAY